MYLPPVYKIDTKMSVLPFMLPKYIKPFLTATSVVALLKSTAAMVPGLHFLPSLIFTVGI